MSRSWIDLAVLAALAVYAFSVVGSFLWRYRAPTGRVTGRGTGFFALPDWARLLVMVVGLPLTAWLTRVLWIRIPLAVPEALQRPLDLLGLTLYLGGIMLTLWGRAALGRVWTITTSVGVRLHEDHRLITTGPFALVRHPMYLGFWLVLAGPLLLYRTWVLAGYLVMALASFSRRARKEEEALGAAFGERWREYAVRVPRWFPGGSR